MKLISLAPNLMVKSVEDTLTYYQNIGFEIINAVKNDTGSAVWAMVQTGNVRLMFQQKESLLDEIAAMEGIPIGGSLNLYITVENIQSLFQKIKNSTKVINDLAKTFYGANEFTIQDLNGYFITFAENGAGN